MERIRINEDEYDMFEHTYQPTSITVVEPAPEYCDTMTARMAFRDDKPTKVKLEFYINDFFRMVKVCTAAEVEGKLRYDNPVLADAYNKYQMLLALYK
jgi:hypothetical protein